MRKWNMIVDVAKCENCHNCTLASADEHVGNDFPGYAAPQPRHGDRWIKITRKVRGSGHMVDAAYLPTMCNHCDDAPCLRAAGDSGAIRKRPDGIMILDPARAGGRRDLVDACPYGAISWNDELQLPQMWIFDAHLLDAGWKEPRAAQSCPTGALQAAKVTDAEMAATAARDGLTPLRPELGTRPRVWYRNLYRFTHWFVGGTVVASVNSRTECVEGATVTLSREGIAIASTTTDLFGDFRFDSLEPASQCYRIDISHPGLGLAGIDVDLDDSRYLGEVLLSAGAGDPFRAGDIEPRASGA